MTKILIIEDDPYISRVYQKTFAFEGFSVQLAEDGDEGIIKAKTFHPDLILLDIMMPKKNGIDTLEELLAASDTQTIPIVMLTNLAGDTNVETALKIGAKGYITKSDHEPEEVVEIVKRVLAASFNQKGN